MFIPYNPPSSSHGKHNRRKINTYVAAVAAAKTSDKQCSRPHKTATTGRATGKADNFTQALHWFPTFHFGDPTGEPPARQADEQGSACGRPEAEDPGAGQLPARAFAAGRFYPIEGSGPNSRGPLALQALAHLYDVLLPYDAKVVGLGKLEADSYARDLLAWTFEHKEVFHSQAAFSLCIMYQKDGSRGAYQAILWHRQHLLKAVRQRLSAQRVDDVLLHSLCTMISVDECLGFHESRAVHLKGLQNIMRVRESPTRASQLTLSGSSAGPGMLPRHSPLGKVVLVNRIMVEFHLKMSLGFQREVDPSPILSNKPPRLLLSPGPATDATSVEDLLPPGFQDLARSGRLTPTVVNLLSDFSSWFYSGMGTDVTTRETWRCLTFTPSDSLEQCISIALVSLADDLSALGSHPCAVIFRQAEQRARLLRSLSSLFDEPWFQELGIWIITVIATPPRTSRLPWLVKMEVLGMVILVPRSPRSGGFSYRSIDQIEGVLRRFFFDESRADDWRRAWKEYFELGGVDQRSLI
ncbi:uncharacterized protein BO95DRAFT_518698 [Aspergillus brunneoviolaceus CBS 621.78]|uniref:Uncharacterized protein n=1 Tax=Aspergillus brunneoviolaceus CBS 621.78 TaxID=1450534 RepID=A0ACD1FU65_9EURO|nr:hypothetical protein BO95DRAFT_518698 [Aspergillus brunneoviolaceus CBS 621.78]RAH40455.1 hypothetical protein BO95DRAFT_518698 [Aspergillus brunneoviolaceus CBS 621.78]